MAVIFGFYIHDMRVNGIEQITLVGHKNFLLATAGPFVNIAAHIIYTQIIDAVLIKPRRHRGIVR